MTRAVRDPQIVGDSAIGADAARVWLAGDGLLLMRAIYRRQAFPRHTHATFVVGINERSAHTFYCRRARHSVPPGTIALVNPEDVHTGESVGDGEWRYRGIYPDARWIEHLWFELAPHAPGVPMFVRSTTEDHEVATILLRFHRMSEDGADPLSVESTAVVGFSMLLLRYADRVAAYRQANGETCRVRRMRDFIHANFTTSISLSALGEVAGLGRFGALRAFQRELGITPYQYVTSLRVERALSLLLRGERIPFVAMAVGFSDQSHLTRRFKRYFGTTPGALARAIQRRVNIIQDS